jgi:Bifunctional DNA primase/polymerase, N-terminal
MIAAALSWLQRGFAVFPLKPRDRIPLGSLVPHCFQDATRDPRVIRDWWRREPEANIGLRTGEGKFVLDLDDAGAVAWFTNAAGLRGEVDRTLTVRTSRGWHLYFKSAADVPCSTSRIAPHVDVKGRGGYVVAAPSIHPDGPVYAIKRDLPIAEAPRKARRPCPAGAGAAANYRSTRRTMGRRARARFRYCFARRKCAARRAQPNHVLGRLPPQRDGSRRPDHAGSRR